MPGVSERVTDAELKRLAGVLKPLQVKTMPLDAPPFGSPLELSRVHWRRPEVVVEVAFSTSTADGLIRQSSYQGQRDDSRHGTWSAQLLKGGPSRPSSWTAHMPEAVQLVAHI